MKKNIWFPVCILVLGILGASCNTSTDPDPDPDTWLPDTWLPVTSLDQLDGTWKWSYQQTMPVKEVFELLDMTWDDSMAIVFGDMNVTISVETTSVINAKEKTQSGSVTITLTFLDGTIKYSWGLIIKPALIQQFPDAKFDDQNHSMTMTQDISEQPITDEEIETLLSSGLQIDQNGKKLKIPTDIILGELSGEIPPGIIPPEIIMTRQ